MQHICIRVCIQTSHIPMQIALYVHTRTHKIQACLYTRTHFFIRDERGKKLGFESVKC